MVRRAFDHAHFAGATDALLARIGRIDTNVQQAVQYGLSGANANDLARARQLNGEATVCGGALLGCEIFEMHLRGRQADSCLLERL